MRCDPIFPPEEGGFDSFRKLALHVQYCPYAPINRGAGDPLEYQAARILAGNMVAEARMKGDKRMAGKQWLPPAASEDAGDDLPGFLGAKHLGKVETRHALRITGFQELGPSQFSPDKERFGLQVIFQKKPRVLPVVIDSVNHRILCEQLGRKPAAWVGKQVSICARQGKFPNPFVAILKD